MQSSVYMILYWDEVIPVNIQGNYMIPASPIKMAEDSESGIRLSKIKVPVISWTVALLEKGTHELSMSSIFKHYVKISQGLQEKKRGQSDIQDI